VRDVGVIERGEQLRFASEAGEAVGITRYRTEKNLDRHVAIKLRVVSAVDLAHSTGSKKGEDLVGTEARTRSKGHCSFRLSLHAPL
jgi:hypothetical protein